MAKQIKYTEPEGYFPKELRDRILAAGKKKAGASAATPAKKAPAKKAPAKKK